MSKEPRLLPGEEMDFDRLGRHRPRAQRVAASRKAAQSRWKQVREKRMGGPKHSVEDRAALANELEKRMQDRAAKKILALIGKLDTIEDCHASMVRLTKAVIAGEIGTDQANSAKGMIKECMKSLAEVQESQRRLEAKKSTLTYRDIASLMYSKTINDIALRVDSSNLEQADESDKPLAMPAPPPSSAASAPYTPSPGK